MNDNPTPSWVEEVEAKYYGVARVWEFPEPTDERMAEPEYKALLAPGYLIFAPGAHPFWSWHTLSGIGLWPIEGLPAANKLYPEAAYEFLVMALDPRHEPPDPRYVWDGQGQKFHFLDPPDANVQFHGVSTKQARSIMDQAARAVSTGMLVPDSDWASRWQEVITTTADHYKRGIHQ